MFCTKCGNKISEKAKFCTSCGTSVTILQPNPDPVSPAIIQEKRSGISKSALWIGLLLIFVGVIAYFIYQQNSGAVKGASENSGNINTDYYKQRFESFHKEIANNNIDNAISYYNHDVMFNGKSMTSYDIRNDFLKTLLKYTPAGTTVLSFKHNYGKSFDYEIDYTLRVNESYDPVVYKKYRIKGVVEFNDSGKIIRIRDISTVQY
jgi:uncharacterized membrane protein YvbJ